jgi:DNA-binding MarR family transcriptional regulator
MTSQVLSDQQPFAIEAWVRLLRGHAATRRSLDAQLQGDHGLTVNDYEALLLLSRADGNRMRRVDLADRVQLTASGVTRLLDGLERQGLVEKATCAADARVTYAVLTDAGRSKLEEAACSHVAAIRGVFEERYTEAELATLTELLSRLPGADFADSCTP